MALNQTSARSLEARNPIGKQTAKLENNLANLDTWQQNGIRLILTKPRLAKRVSYTAFGGKDSKTLYIATGNRVYKRRTKLIGAQPWQAPVKPPRPGL